MAVAELFGTVKSKAKKLYDRFFYADNDAPVPEGQGGYYAGQEQPQNGAPQQQYPPYGAQPVYQQPVYQQPVYQHSFAGPVFPQNEQNTAYQQPGGYQQPAQQPRNRRTAQHAAQQAGNIVDFTAFQQSQSFQQPQQPEQESAPQQGTSLLNARVINARNMGDCRSAITLLRKGDAVLVVMESISEPGEMRRLVDTLSGACYSLTATITKVSRSGVYFLAPQTMAVFTDQTTNLMNNVPLRTQAPNYQPVYGNQRPAYQAQPFIPQQSAAQQQPVQQAAYQGAMGFTQRAAAPEEAPQSFYQRPAPQTAPTPEFSAQPAGYGYTPDDSSAAEM